MKTKPTKPKKTTTKTTNSSICSDSIEWLKGIAHSHSSALSNVHLDIESHENRIRALAVICVIEGLILGALILALLLHSH